MKRSEEAAVVMPDLSFLAVHQRWRFTVPRRDRLRARRDVDVRDLAMLRATDVPLRRLMKHT